ncbi:MAG: hypothetical protein RRB13_01335 [bacterium]|nr:hypothetical protein [bacterium]
MSSFFLQFADVFALMLALFGLTFFLLRRFFHWFFSIQAGLDGLHRIEAHLVQMDQRIAGLEQQLSDLVEQNPLVDQAATERLKKVAKETLQSSKPLPSKRLETDFRPADERVKAEVERRRQAGACLHCGLSLDPSAGALFCSNPHEEEYFAGNYVQPLNLPFNTQEES